MVSLILPVLSFHQRSASNPLFQSLLSPPPPHPTCACFLICSSLWSVSPFYSFLPWPPCFHWLSGSLCLLQPEPCNHAFLCHHDLAPCIPCCHLLSLLHISTPRRLLVLLPCLLSLPRRSLSSADCTQQSSWNVGPRGAEQRETVLVSDLRWCLLLGKSSFLTQPGSHASHCHGWLVRS